ncbi:SDR family NAD(P)-dependent oxidoreductase [Bradyrhizobium sp. AZCC 2262]|uniref:SDR family NAD(P)-dependent oxidoreductase n=1 Tax=Bradyrhizobium sp. AZCC 2262 TaxID=3117022 RepID=UPI003FA5813B
MPMPSTEKPLVVISGAAKGIGRACAEAFLATGWHVAALDYDAEPHLRGRKKQCLSNRDRRCRSGIG